MQGSSETHWNPQYYYPQSKCTWRTGAAYQGFEDWRNNQLATAMENGKETTEEKNTIQIEISPGEAFDRLTILGIKKRRVRDQAKQERVKQEECDLMLALIASGIQTPERLGLGKNFRDLVAVNEALWDVEDRLRAMEARGDFGTNFVGDARSVYKLNDARSALKTLLDEAYGHPAEVKEYSHGEEEGKEGPDAA